MPRKLKPTALNSQAYFPHDLTITPEVLSIQASVTGPGQDMEWLWTWTTSSLPYSRVNITTQAQTSVPLYRQGTYQVDNFAGVQTHSGMTQTHSLYLKWIEGAGTANLVPWVTYQNSGVTSSHPSINSGTTTGVQRLIINVPSTITLPTLVAPNISYNVTTTTGAWVFSGNAHGNNPNIGPFYRGGTYTFNLSNATGHPFYLTEDSGAGFVAGQYVDEWTSGVTNSRATSGTVTFVVPNNAPDVLYYQCGNHANMRGTIRIKDLAVEVNNNGNPIIYFQHTQDNHVTPVELRPIPSLVNQMCVVYDAASGKFVPQDLATYIERTPSFKNKIQEVAGTATLVNADGTPAVSSVKILPYANYLPLLGNNEGDIAFTADTESLYVWNGTQWKATGTAGNVSDKPNTSTGSFSLPSGTTAQRPASPTVGMIRYNTTLGFVEQYTIDGWQGIAPPPTITAISPTSYNGEQGTSFTITGSNFDSTATVKFITAQGTEYSAATTTRINNSQLTATTPQDFTIAQEPLKVKVVNGSGLSYTLDNAVDCGSTPVWSTAANTTLTTVFVGSSINTSIAATDSDAGATISYSIASGSLPTGITLNSTTGAITGTTSGATGTFTFTARVTDNAGNYADRAFSIVVNALPTGGSITTSGSYRIHTFTSSDNFITNGAISSLEVLMVAGGGSGGSGNNNEGGGGGGAGGLLYGTTSLSAGTYGVTIGAGGAYGGRNSGNNTTFNGWTANAGGYGGDCSGGGGSGGSGGGGSGCGQDWPGGSANQGGQGPLTGYGNSGGLGHWTGGGAYHSDGQGGGGGGAGSVGQEYRTNGSGRTYSISGANINYAVGGYGGAGRSGNYCGANGAANTGSGGEGSVNCNPSGGSGIVILRYQV